MPFPDNSLGHITVVGPDAASVQQARELLELFTENHELKPHQIDYLSRDYGMLGERANILYLFYSPTYCGFPSDLLMKLLGIVK